MRPFPILFGFAAFGKPSVPAHIISKTYKIINAFFYYFICSVSIFQVFCRIYSYKLKKVIQEIFFSDL